MQRAKFIILLLVILVGIGGETYYFNKKIGHLSATLVSVEMKAAAAQASATSAVTAAVGARTAADAAITAVKQASDTATQAANAVAALHVKGEPSTGPKPKR